MSEAPAQTPANRENPTPAPPRKRPVSTPTVAIINRSGRFGNRLQCSAYVLAAALEYGFKVKLFSLEGYERSLSQYARRPLRTLFNRLQRKILDQVAQSDTFQRLLGIRLLEGEKDAPLILSSQEALSEVFSHRLTLLTSFYVYCHPSILQKHRPELEKRLGLRPARTERKYVEQVRAEARGHLIGIHIRRGDYKEYGGGEFYYPLSQYESLARSLEQEAGADGATFLICSDEKIPETAFSGLDWRPGPGSLTGDMYGLTRCDYIMGPPSTFNRWCAFIAGVPRYQITKDDHQLRFEDFKPQGDLESQGYWDATG